MKSIPILEPVSESINFTKEEEKVLEYWKLVDAFGKCVEESASGEVDKPRFSFYDGPPFATGLPHYGHILAGTIKDIVPRFAHQSGYHVERRFGWDCHGLPVEYEVDKALGINGPQDVMKMGIKAYNDECRKIVMRYSNEWETVIGRLGRWIDFKNDYKTLYPWFMESVWWIFKQLYDKGLVYRGFKVMPFSTACNTPLSNFETAQNYKEVVDPSVIVSFPMISKPDVSLLAWTTTPWTLPSNLALCVHPEHTYLLVMEKKTSKKFILMEARVSSLYRTENEYEILDKFPGSKLKGEKYEPLFKYFIGEKDKAFKVLADDYVSQDSGTGIVQMAPYFGADDYRICLDAGIIFKDQDMICPVDSSGRFTEPVKDFLGMYVKDADKAILARLKENGRLINSSTIKHSYPFCWRSDTPLIYRAVPSWFIKVESLVEKLLANNQKTYWVPEFVKEKRFANWLRDAHDWAVSRNRYWGTPIPIWASDDFKEVVCIGSMDDLAKHSGKPSPTDLHREFVDDIIIPSKRPGQPPLKRVPEVFDCWFESGSMPYAQKHYPFENKEKFEQGFPADFIAEGVDQTRGWFYTLLVISTALFDKPPFKNLVVNGLVLASDGQKMSKRKKNYPDPMEVVNKYGADALRLYLINSPVVRAENLRFKEEGVRDLLKDVFIPWFNAYRFLIQNVLRVHTEDKYILMFDDKLNEAHSTDISKWNIMDRWVLSSVQSLILWFQQEMAAYRLYTVVPRLVKFVESLTNWYVRLNRKRLRGEDSNEDCYRSLEVLYLVMYSLTILMAPFTPFITETMYQKLKGLIKSEEAKKDSVHHVMIPQPQKWVINKEIETSVCGMQSVIELGRLARDRRAIPTKFPLPEIIVIHSSEDFLNEIKVLENYILQELNIRKMTLSTNKSKYNIKISGEPDHKILGGKYKSDFKAISTEIKNLTGEQLEQCVEKGSINILGHEILSTEMFIKYSFGEGQATEFEAASSGSVLVILNTLSDSTLKDEFVAREIINRIQKLRKKASLIPTDKMNVFYQTEDKYIASVFENCKDFIKTTVKSDVEPFKKDMKNYMVLMTEDYQFQGADMTLALAIAKNDNKNGGTACRYVNIIHKGENGVEKKGTILLENPIGFEITKLEQILAEAKLVFDLKGKKPVFISENACHNDVVIDIKDKLTDKLHGQTVYLFVADTYSVPVKTTSSLSSKKSSKPFVQFLNFDISRAGIRKEGTVLLENPIGNQLFESEEEATQFGWKTLFPES